MGVRGWLLAGAGQVLTYPHPAVKLLNGTTPAVATYMHRDGLSSVRAITDPAGVKIESALYKPFGEQSEWLLPGNAAPETKGWIGERFDADAGLQYLNARYYDPALGLFLQPDWFEVTKAGVGTNRFSYSFNDPVNKFDPGGNDWNPTNGDEFDPEKTPPVYTKRTYIDDMTDVLRASGRIAYDAGAVAASVALPDFQELTNGDLTWNDALEVASIVPIGKVAKWGVGLIRGAETTADVTKVADGAVDATKTVCSFDGATLVLATYLHRDGLSSVRAITSAAGVKIESALYKPFGEQSEWLLPGNAAPETKGWIGERYDADAGLQYLNARYYDPELSLFLQPDWFEVTKAGVGTNRFSYSFNDPVNKADPAGNSWLDRTWDRVFGEGSFNRSFGDRGSRWSDAAVGNQYEKDYSKFHAAVSPQAGFPAVSYPDSKRQFAENATMASGQAASGDAIFDIIGGAGIAKSVVQLGMKGAKALLGKSAAKTLSIRTVGELGEAAVRAAHDIGPKELVEMFGRNRYPDGVLQDVLSEVKNVARQSYTRQLRDYAAYAAANGMRFDLYVRAEGGTQLAGTLRAAVDAGEVFLKEFIPWP